MARVRRKPQAKTTATAAKRPRLAPDRPILVLAILGVLLTAYLLFVNASAGGAAFCAEGSSCEIVQESRWSTLFGLPIALWGLGLYALIALVSVTGSHAAARWRRLWTLSLIGLLISVYLTIVAAVGLGAFCLWCTISLLLIGAIFVLATLRRPAQGPNGGWPRWIGLHAMTLLPALLLIAAAQAGWLSPPADPRLDALAVHLSERSDAKYYGAFWCPNCLKQRRMFGRSADKLPYVECSPNGRNSAIAFECASQGIDSFPTWVIRGQRYNGMLTPEELARHSRFAWNAPIWTGGEAEQGK
ncbi:MAG: vitamin K epoxide reductase family protein [Lysobacteraceae bacterium]